ncbi:penicillin-binding protein 1C [Paracoccus marinaquae]|uniref:Penicillin-binding protein 1C n=1 Tax=Paracoccus marinaquae TaxID=2841926 RepID=A0ABS6AP43_9RHOB|nr:penicillin-binding protein 1C [Paracoccus marinaquae]MBU3031887.1 penicillin-binding protein 1C [Paracoccus marinaquae]
MRRHGLFLLVLALWLTAAGRDALDDWIERTDLPPLAVATGAEVLARDGSLLRAFPVADGRWRLDPGPVDPGFVAMLLAYEDRRFYRHAGVDPLAMLRAAGQSLLAGRFVSGGSTLTMQVARLLEEGPTGEIGGKLRQMRVAMALERRLGKAQILDLYLRIAPYGGNLEGIRAATLSWFGKEPRRLTPAQAALMVALPQSPTARRPDRSPDAAWAARNRVLARAAARGVLSRAEADAARDEALPLARRPFPALAPHLTGALHRADPAARRIATTIDPALQRAAEALARRAIRGQAEAVTAALIFADHRTGEVLAHVGAADWTNDRQAGFIDMTAALRSPGSTLKPFVYALAFDDNLAHPETLIEDRPVALGRYAPQNFDRRFRGTVTLRQALTASLNIPAVRLADAVGPARLMALLKRAGAGIRLPGGEPGLAVVLGGAGVSLGDLTQAYAGLASLGQRVDLSPLPGQGGRRRQRLFGPVAAWQVGHMLAGIAPPEGAPPDRIAYKTGTSYGYRDALALGFDGRHVGAVWMGRADGTPVPGAFGGDRAAPVLFELFARVGAPGTPLPPPPPATLMLGNAQLPQPLRHFRAPDQAVADARTGGNAPQMAFPPDGARIEAPSGRLVVKVRDGAPPYTWLANGAPVAVASPDPATEIDLPPGAGFVDLAVIDARGRSAAAQITVLP